MHNAKLAMGLEECLRGSLPLGSVFDLLHLQSVPRETSPIVHPEPKEVQDDKLENSTNSNTIKTQHFFALCNNEKIVYALEVVVYFKINSSYKPAEKLIFVSKADTNGYSDVHVNIGKVTKSLLLYLLTIDPEHYLKKVKPLVRPKLNKYQLIRKRTPITKALKILSERKLKGINSRVSIPEKELFVSFPTPKDICTKISLFTRAEPQYLFSNSSRNPSKHVLTGEKLLKWWIKIIDEVVHECFDKTTIATLQIPGEETRIISNYLKNKLFTNWQVGDIFCKSPDDIALYRIPLFPDDPKGRFLEHLIQDGRIHQVTVSTFWTELQARQEFRLGSTVSVIGVSGTFEGPVITPPSAEIIIPESKRRFKNLKNYIIGEEYDTVEGSEEAYMNICDYLASKTDHAMIHITGTYKHQTSKKETKSSLEKRLPHNVINTVSVSKRIKR